MYAQIVSWQLNLLLNRTIVIMRHKFLLFRLIFSSFNKFELDFPMLLLIPAIFFPTSAPELDSLILFPETIALPMVPLANWPFA